MSLFRQAEAGKLRITVAAAYEYLRESLADFRRLAILRFTDGAELLFRQWREQRIRIATHDLRIAAICVDTPAASYDLAGTEYTFYMNPHVAKDFSDALVLKIAADYLPSVHRPWHEKPFATGTLVQCTALPSAGTRDARLRSRSMSPLPSIAT